MKASLSARPGLRAETAAELMRTNPLSLRDDATVTEAIRFLADKGFSAAPVIDERGRPVGVLSSSDVLIYDRERRPGEPATSAYYGDTHLAARDESDHRGPDLVRVRDLMTPVVFAVGPEATAAEAITNMVQLKVHRLFVVDDAGIPIGVISALDVLHDLVS